MHQYIEGFRNTRSRDIITHDNGFIGLGSADDIVGLQGQQLLENVGGAIGFKRPHFHFTKTLTTKLCLTTQRLLSNETVRPDATCVHLIVHHVMELDDINDTYRSLLVKAIARLTIIEVSIAKAGQSGPGDMIGDFLYRSTVEDRRCEFHTQLLTGPAKYSFIDLSKVHTGRYTQRVQYHIHRCSVFQERHIFRPYDLGDDTLVTVTSGHLIPYLQLTLDGQVYLSQLQYTGW